MKTKVRLCKLLFSTRLLVSLLIILGILECLQWLQGEGKSSKSLLLSDYPELSSSSMMSSSSSNFASSAGLPGTAVPASELAKVKIEPEKKSTDNHQNILLLAYARSGKLHILIQRVFWHSNGEIIVVKAPLSRESFCQLVQGQLTIMNHCSGDSCHINDTSMQLRYTVLSSKRDKTILPDTGVFMMIS